MCKAAHRRFQYRKAGGDRPTPEPSCGQAWCLLRYQAVEHHHWQVTVTILVSGDVRGRRRRPVNALTALTCRFRDGHVLGLVVDDAGQPRRRRADTPSSRRPLSTLAFGRAWTAHPRTIASWVFAPTPTARATDSNDELCGGRSPIPPLYLIVCGNRATFILHPWSRVLVAKEATIILTRWRSEHAGWPSPDRLGHGMGCIIATKSRRNLVNVWF